MFPLLKAVGSTYRQSFSGLPRDVWLLSLILLVNRSGQMVVPFLALYFTRSLEFSKTSAGYLLGAYGVGAIAGAILGGWLTVRWGAIRVQFTSLLLTAVGFMVLGQLQGFWPLMIWLFLLSAIGEAVRPANATAITDYSPPEKHRQCLALNRMAMNLGMSIGPTLGGLLATFNYQWLFWVDALTCGLRLSWR